MPTITTTDGVDIFFKDWGSGQPIVFSHGWPLSSDDWDNQMLFFLAQGYRVIAADRRGHGRSSQVAARPRRRPLRRRPARRRRTPGPARRHTRRTLHRWRRSNPVPGPPRRKTRSQNRANLRGAAADGADGDESRRLAQERVRRSAGQLAANRSKFYRDLPSGPFYGFNRPGVRADRSRHRQLVASRHDGRRQSPLRRHRDLLSNRLHAKTSRKSPSRPW